MASNLSLVWSCKIGGARWNWLTDRISASSLISEIRWERKISSWESKREVVFFLKKDTAIIRSFSHLVQFLGIKHTVHFNSVCYGFTCVLALVLLLHMPPLLVRLIRSKPVATHHRYSVRWTDMEDDILFLCCMHFFSPWWRKKMLLPDIWTIFKY